MVLEVLLEDIHSELVLLNYTKHSMPLLVLRALTVNSGLIKSQTAYGSMLHGNIENHYNEGMLSILQ